MRTLSSFLTDAKFRKFLIVGVSNTLIAYLVFISAVTLFAGRPWRGALAQIIAYAVATVWSYCWNRAWSFRSTGAVRAEATRFVLAQGGCLAVSSAAIGLLVDISGFPPTPAWVVVTAAVVLLNFAILRSWVFRPAGAARSAE